jgi:micrococcal nuclease
MSKAFVILLAILLLTSCSTQHKVMEYQKTPNYESPKITNTSTTVQSSKDINFNQLSENNVSASNNTGTSEVSDGLKKVKVVSVINGDTLVYLENGVKKTAHLIGVESPTNEVQQKETTEYLKHLVLGKEIEIEGEPKEGMIDKYGRYLIYGFVGGRSIQYLLLKEGLVYTAHHYKDFKYGDIYQQAESIAKDAKANIWGTIPSTDNGSGFNLKESSTAVKTKFFDGVNH